MEAGLRASWDAVREGLADGAAGGAVPALFASTLPELLQDASAAAFLDRGVPAVAGLRTALACAAALQPARRRIPLGCGRSPRRRRDGEAAGGRWLCEADAKALLRAHGMPVPDGRVAADADDAVRAAAELGGAVALKASSPTLRHKSEPGALVLGVERAGRGPRGVRARRRAGR